MNISIDNKVLEKTITTDGQKLDICELLICMIVMMNGNPTEVTQKLINRGVLLKDSNEKLHVFRKYSELVDRILLESDRDVPSIGSLEELVLKLQELFPKEKKPDSNGVPKYAYRGNKTDVANRLQKFFKLYGKYSYDDVLECTKRYVESFKYDKTYMKILPYYIIKDGESQLATELENMDTEDAKEVNNDLNYGDMLI